MRLETFFEKFDQYGVPIVTEQNPTNFRGSS